MFVTDEDYADSEDSPCACIAATCSTRSSLCRSRLQITAPDTPATPPDPPATPKCLERHSLKSWAVDLFTERSLPKVLSLNSKLDYASLFYDSKNFPSFFSTAREVAVCSREAAVCITALRLESGWLVADAKKKVRGEIHSTVHETLDVSDISVEDFELVRRLDLDDKEFHEDVSEYRRVNISQMPPITFNGWDQWLEFFPIQCDSGAFSCCSCVPCLPPSRMTWFRQIAMDSPRSGQFWSMHRMGLTHRCHSRHCTKKDLKTTASSSRTLLQNPKQDGERMVKCGKGSSVHETTPYMSPSRMHNMLRRS